LNTSRCHTILQSNGHVADPQIRVVKERQRVCSWELGVVVDCGSGKVVVVIYQVYIKRRLTILSLVTIVRKYQGIGNVSFISLVKLANLVSFFSSIPPLYMYFMDGLCLMHLSHINIQHYRNIPCNASILKSNREFLLRDNVLVIELSQECPSCQLYSPSFAYGRAVRSEPTKFNNIGLCT
jgi:hypothetical protein